VLGVGNFELIVEVILYKGTHTIGGC